MSLKQRCRGTEKRKDGWTLISNSYSQEATNSRCRILEMDIFFTWILHQITMYSNEVKRAAGSNNDTHITSSAPLYCITFVGNFLVPVRDFKG